MVLAIPTGVGRYPPPRGGPSGSLRPVLVFLRPARGRGSFCQAGAGREDLTAGLLRRNGGGRAVPLKFEQKIEQDY